MLSCPSFTETLPVFSSHDDNDQHGDTCIRLGALVAGEVCSFERVATSWYIRTAVRGAALTDRRIGGWI